MLNTQFQPHGGVAERIGSGLQSRPHGFESRFHLQELDSSSCAIGAAVARFPDTEEVTGSIPVSRTGKRALALFTECLLFAV